MSAIDQAMAALTKHWVRAGQSADGDRLERIRTALRDRYVDGYRSDWRTLLDHAMSDLGCTIDWRNDQVHSVMVWGDPMEPEKR
ncbi:hypothetical protein [Methylobacterium planeticum]|uniref:Uncharacterized protein n=1 Tax=Methylobacterium planeticum TaxID=2615211 RepID=A0A6N6MLN3_9HYPH|nr:hypothetical protein [Methylobacterium planeticum]KAB1071582.1 hypothetical protein F6X51_18600 [Methylobacterium planeticum]